MPLNSMNPRSAASFSMRKVCTRPVSGPEPSASTGLPPFFGSAISTTTGRRRVRAARNAPTPWPSTSVLTVVPASVILRFASWNATVWIVSRTRRTRRTGGTGAVR